MVRGRLLMTIGMTKTRKWGEGEERNGVEGGKKRGGEKEGKKETAGTRSQGQILRMLQKRFVDNKYIQRDSSCKSFWSLLPPLPSGGICSRAINLIVSKLNP